MVPGASLPRVPTDAAHTPPPAASSFASRFVSDYAFAGYKPVCQRKLMHAMARSQLGAAAARAYPPSLLEWTANRQQASMALDLHCFNGAGGVGLGHAAVRVRPSLGHGGTAGSCSHPIPPQVTSSPALSTPGPQARTWQGMS